MSDAPYICDHDISPLLEGDFCRHRLDEHNPISVVVRYGDLSGHQDRIIWFNRIDAARSKPAGTLRILVMGDVARLCGVTPRQRSATHISA
jgi:hypothetical protein